MTFEYGCFFECRLVRAVGLTVMREGRGLGRGVRMIPELWGVVRSGRQVAGGSVEVLVGIQVDHAELNVRWSSSICTRKAKGRVAAKAQRGLPR